MSNPERINSQLATLVAAMQKLRDAGVDGDVISVGGSRFDDLPMVSLTWDGFAKLFRGQSTTLSRGRFAAMEWNGVKLTSVYNALEVTKEITIE